jgi:lipopolysaccharide biosynthesis glycosyltransferase
MMAERIVIACASDDRYVRPLSAMLRSVIDNLGDGYAASVYVLQSGIGEADREAVTSGWPPHVIAHWVDADTSAFAGLPLWGRMPISTYFKLGLGDFLPLAEGRAIWLDCDVIALDDVAELWHTPLGGKVIGAAQDAVVPLVSSRYGIARYRELGMSPDAKYFNAGVMLVDLDAWRNHGVRGRAVDYLKRCGSSVTFWDQEGLNAALAGAWSEMDSRWNFNASIPGAHAGGSELPSIVHFAGGLKPWRFRTRDELRSLYYVYLDRTAFRGWRPAPGMAGGLVSLYERSGLRKLMYPAENIAMRMVRQVTREQSL